MLPLGTKGNTNLLLLHTDFVGTISIKDRKYVITLKVCDLDDNFLISENKNKYSMQYS